MLGKKTNQLDKNNKFLIIIAIVIVTLLTVGSAYGYYNLVKNNLSSSRPKIGKFLKNKENLPKQKIVKGEVVQISDSEAILSAFDGDWTVKFTPKTQYRQDMKRIGKNDIQVDDQVNVFGKRDDAKKHIDAILIRKAK